MGRAESIDAGVNTFNHFSVVEAVNTQNLVRISKQIWKEASESPASRL